MNSLPVPHHRQTQQADCLPACVAMVLDYLGRPLDYDTLLRILGTTSYGTIARRVLRLTGPELNVIYSEGGLADLKAYLDRRLPVIVLVKTGELPYWTYNTLHSVVVVGYDDSHIYVNDPVFDQIGLPVPTGDFELAWLEMGNRYLVIEPV